MKNIHLSVFILVCAFFLISCKPAPTQERAAAESSIKKAREIKADQFSTETFGLAVNDYELGESLIVVDKKSSKNGKALESYVSAKENADLSYTQSLGPFYSEKNGELRAALDEGIEEGLKMTSELTFLDAEEQYELAGQLIGEGGFEDALLAMEASYDKLDLARQEAAQLLLDIEQKRQEAVEKIDLAIEEKAEYATPNELARIEQELNSGDEEVEAFFYADALMTYESTISLALDMLALIKEKRDLAREELDLADGRLNQMEANVKVGDTENLFQR